MVRHEKSKAKISDFLPKAAGPVNFMSPPPSPARTPSRKGCRSPQVSLVPKEIRRKARSLSFDVIEPNSPKVSCIGSVRNKGRNKSKTKNKLTKIVKVVAASFSWPFKRKQESQVGCVFDRNQVTTAAKLISLTQQYCVALESPQHDVSDIIVPKQLRSLSQVKKFASGRGVLRDFDWKTHAVGEDERIEDKQNDVASCSKSIANDSNKCVGDKCHFSPPTPLPL
ncbi:uncharacterized protein At1g76070-like [Mercurialis annua]|uniref:uncharacterized protein At1g76070-like n=1 Tax=Mercurialis annua TaxID=3986 RepID=UPI00215E1158|nr:uncharacterized protein At1g76070-like [Mercurialis annua]